MVVWSLKMTTTKKKEKKETHVLNCQFEPVFTQEDMNDLPTISTPKFPPIPDIDISTDGVEKLLADLDVTKATGPDDIPSRILKMGAAEIAPALTTIFRRSLETGSLPDDWRRAYISPIFKKGDRTKPARFHWRLYVVRSWNMLLILISCAILTLLIFWPTSSMAFAEIDRASPNTYWRRMTLLCLSTKSNRLMLSSWTLAKRLMWCHTTGLC